MKLDALRLVTPLRIRLEPAGTAAKMPKLNSGDEVRLIDDDGTLVLAGATGSCDVRACDRPSQQELDGLLRRGQPRLAWVAKEPTRKGEIQINLIEASSMLAHGEPEGWVVSFDAKIRDDLRKRIQHQKSTPDSEYISWLADQLVIAGTALHPEPRLLVTASPSSGSNPRRAPFRIWGSSLAVDVLWTEQEGQGAYVISRVIHSSRLSTTERSPIWIVVGGLTVRDEAAALTKRLAALDVVDDEGRGYLKLWEDYQTIEEKLAQDRALQLGSLHYMQARKRESSWHFYVADPEVLSRLGGQREVELEVAAAEKGARRAFCGTVDIQASTPGGPGLPTCLVLRSQGEDSEPPGSGLLRVSMRGLEANWKRRQQALVRIRTNSAATIPLTSILEGRSTRSMRGRSVSPLSPAVRAVFGPAGPTEAQIKALDVALNTPDIAIIQGPPGTGKTQVIRALALRLSELGEGEEVRGNLLLSSFQHEAVEHVSGLIRIFGLPALKLGRRRDRAASTSSVDEWRIQLMNRLSARPACEPRPVYRVLDEARATLSAAIRGMAPAAAAQAVERIADACRAWIPAEVLEGGRTLQRNLYRLSEVDARSASERSRFRGIAFGLRTSQAGHADDGPHRITAILGLARSRQVELSPSEFEALDDARLEETVDAELLGFIAATRDRILDSLTETVQVLPRQASRDDVSEWLRRVIVHLHGAAQSLPDDAEIIVADFREALEHDRDAVATAITHYTTALAATCVQSVAPVMAESLQLSEQKLGFRNVVVDEAARANPLDLLIPMSLAGRRLILVGDHRQLPHSLEPEVERAIDQDPSIEAKEALKMSLFERLKSQLTGGDIPRVVTLDRQYRMHPLLASFVSDTFYAPYDESFGSGVTAAEREHGLSELGSAVAAWIDVPSFEGPEKRHGASLTRNCEASVIAKRLRSWLEERPTLSFAVVTFYAAQVNVLWSALRAEGLAEGGSDGVPYAIRSDLRQLSTGGERLRIGTVDAFQGKEFDVVFLSQVRSNDIPVDKTPVSWRRRWGFLLLENRMCVALSRQRRALVVVGDPAMVEGEVAAHQIAGLVRFRTLCGGEHGRILAV